MTASINGRNTDSRAGIVTTILKNNNLINLKRVELRLTIIGVFFLIINLACWIERAKWSCDGMAEKFHKDIPIDLCNEIEVLIVSV